jgi:D-serine deaminase-like pyridoxal phosphate-dependent protein
MNNIIRPTLLINKKLSIGNIELMAKKAKSNGLIFRPHFKTHQSAEIGEWFREAGVNSITVSSVSMAYYFADHGWKDITIAFPCNILEIDEINALAASVCINLLVESAEVASFLAKNTRFRTGIFIKIDTGYHRTGIEPENSIVIKDILTLLGKNKNLLFKGFLTHTGQTYYSRDIKAIRKQAEQAMFSMNGLKEKFIHEYPEILLSFGDTPSCSILEDFPGIDEIRPGNFVFYDLMQYFIGSCSLESIAVAVACPVVAVHPERNEAVIYGGAVHLSKEVCITPNGNQSYGLAVGLGEDGWNVNQVHGHLTSLSQEHGILQLNEGENLSPGDLVAILPVHSCLAVHQFPENRIVFSNR